MKGVSEDIPAILFVMVLLVVFILSILHSYNSYFGSVNLMQQKRIASSIAESIAFNTKVVEDPTNFVKSFDKTGIRVDINNTVPGKVCSGICSSSGKTFQRNALISSAAFLIKDGNNFYPARVDVYVGE